MARHHVTNLSGINTVAVWASVMVDHNNATTLQRFLESLADG